MNAELHIENQNIKVKIVLPNPSTMEKQQLLQTMQQVLNLSPRKIRTIKYTAFKKAVDESSSELDKPDFSVRQTPNGMLYQCYYTCPECEHKLKLFIPKTQDHVTCESCGHVMAVRPAHPGGFPNKDKFGNYFIAGSFEYKE